MAALSSPQTAAAWATLGWRAAWCATVGGGATVVGVLSHADSSLPGAFSRLPPVGQMQALGALAIGAMLLTGGIAAVIAKAAPEYKPRLPGVLGWLLVLGLSGLPALFAVSVLTAAVQLWPIEQALGYAGAAGGLLALVSWIRLISLTRRPS